MNERQGRLLHKTVTKHGVIEILDEDLVRSLYFGSHARQSSMLKANPVELVLPYTRAMMSALLFTGALSSALVIGIGGGSLVRFIHHHYPQCHIDAVDTSSETIDIARRYFGLPETPLLEIHVSDGADYVAGTERQYDLLMVDAFDKWGMVDSVSSSDFFHDSLERLAEKGVFSINLWGSDKHAYKTLLGKLKMKFPFVLELPVMRKGNMIVLGFRQPLSGRWYRQLRSRARELQQATGLDFPLFLKMLYKKNIAFHKRLFS
jgi:spermidine synthase